MWAERCLLAGRLGLLLACVACRGQATPSEAAGTSHAATTRQAASGSAVSNAPELIDWGPGRYALHARAALQLGANARLERRTAAGAYASVSLAGGFRLSGRCGEPAAASDCIALATGDVLGPVAYDGGSCAGVCCPGAGDALESGTFRWVLAPCGSSTVSWPGPDFTLPASANALYRARAAARLASVTVLRLDARDVVEGVAFDNGRVAGIAVAAGRESPMADESVEALAAWLEGSGFDDRVVRRCKRSQAFGFRGWRRGPGVEPEETEIAVDFGCNSLAVIHREGQRRLRTDAFFDASRDTLIAILNRAMPGALGPR